MGLVIINSIFAYRKKKFGRDNVWWNMDEPEISKVTGILIRITSNFRRVSLIILFFYA